MGCSVNLFYPFDPPPTSPFVTIAGLPFWDAVPLTTALSDLRFIGGVYVVADRYIDWDGATRLDWIYVGQSVDIGERLREHRRESVPLWATLQRGEFVVFHYIEPGDSEQAEARRLATEAAVHQELRPLFGSW